MSLLKALQRQLAQSVSHCGCYGEGVMRAITGWCIVSVTLMILLLSVRVSSSKLNPDHLSDAAGLLSMRDCLGCHEKAEGDTICLGDYCLNGRSKYPPVGKEKAYASLSELGKADCMLEDGRVSCLSCHDLTKPAPHVIRDGHQLCLICHIRLTASR